MYIKVYKFNLIFLFFFVKKSIHYVKITLSQKVLFQISVINILQAFYVCCSNISDSIHDRHILNNVCDLYQKSNLIISQFRSCDSETLDRLHKAYCMHMYGCEL